MMKLTREGVKTYLDSFSDAAFPLILVWYTREAAVGTNYMLKIVTADCCAYSDVRHLARAKGWEAVHQTQKRARVSYARVVSLVDAYCAMRGVTPPFVTEFKP